MENPWSPLTIIASICVLLNLVCFSMDAYGNSDTLDTFIDETNTYTSWIFVAEAGLKISGLGISYFDSIYNKIDLTVVVTFIVEETLTSSTVSISALRCRRGCTS